MTPAASCPRGYDRFGSFLALDLQERGRGKCHVVLAVGDFPLRGARFCRVVSARMFAQIRLCGAARRARQSNRRLIARRKSTLRGGMRSQIRRFNKSSRALQLGQSLGRHMPALTDAEDFPDDDCLVGSGQPIKVQTAFPVAVLSHFAEGKPRLSMLPRAR